MPQIFYPPASYATGYAPTRSSSAYPLLWDGLVGAWCPSLGQQSSLKDLSGNGQDGAITGGTWVNGFRGKELQLSGVEASYVQMTNINRLNLATNASVAAWMYIEETATNRWVTFSKRVGASINTGFAIFSEGDGNIYWRLFIGGSIRDLVVANTMASNRWMHIAGTYNGVDQKLYIDGKEVGTRAQTGSINAGSGNAEFGNFVGSAATPTYALQGRIEVLVYNRGLAAQEVQALALGAWPFRRRFDPVYLTKNLGQTHTVDSLLLSQFIATQSSKLISIPSTLLLSRAYQSTSGKLNLSGVSPLLSVTQVCKTAESSTSSSSQKYPGTVTSDSEVSGAEWDNFNNAKVDDGIFTNAGPLTSGGNLTTRYLKCTNFSFDIPTNATIAGILLEVDRKRNGISFVKDYRIRLVKAGTVQTEDKSVVPGWSSSSETQSYGGSGDLWNNTWSPSDINNSGFGAAISGQLTGGDGPITAQVDFVRLTVYYTIPPLDTTTSMARMIYSGQDELRSVFQSEISGKCILVNSTPLLSQFIITSNSATINAVQVSQELISQSQIIQSAKIICAASQNLSSSTQQITNSNIYLSGGTTFLSAFNTTSSGEIVLSPSSNLLTVFNISQLGSLSLPISTDLQSKTQTTQSSNVVLYILGDLKSQFNVTDSANLAINASGQFNVQTILSSSSRAILVLNGDLLSQIHTGPTANIITTANTSINTVFLTNLNLSSILSVLSDLSSNTSAIVTANTLLDFNTILPILTQITPFSNLVLVNYSSLPSETKLYLIPDSGQFISAILFSKTAMSQGANYIVVPNIQLLNTTILGPAGSTNLDGYTSLPVIFDSNSLGGLLKDVSAALSVEASLQTTPLKLLLSFTSLSTSSGITTASSLAIAQFVSLLNASLVNSNGFRLIDQPATIQTCSKVDTVPSRIIYSNTAYDIETSVSFIRELSDANLASVLGVSTQFSAIPELIVNCSVELDSAFLTTHNVTLLQAGLRKLYLEVKKYTGADMLFDLKIKQNINETVTLKRTVEKDA